MSYIVKLTGCRVDGRKVDGEYEGGATIDGARTKADGFALWAPSGRIAIVSPIQPDDDELLELIEVVRDR